MESHSKERREGLLDYPITDEEFEAAINKLKARKSPGIDNILNEVIKIGKGTIKGHLVNLFNRILDTARQALYISPQQSTVRLHGSKRNF